MAVDYLKKTIDTLMTLPIEIQVEVHDFTLFQKSSLSQGNMKTEQKAGSVLNIVGIGKSGLGDLSINHGKYLYDK